MEALAAISLAGNILQFLEFTSDVISKSRQIHTSISGTLKVHDDLGCLTTDLKGLSDRLQTSTGPVDSVLGQLCSKCSDAAGELLDALETLRVKGKHSPCQNLRKALKTLWSKEKLKSLGQTLASFRQELNLHITVQLRSRLDILSLQQTQFFQDLDNATKEAVQKVLDVLQDNKDHLVATTNRQTQQLRELHAQTDEVLHSEFQSAATNLVEQSETTRIFNAEEHEKSRTEVLNAIADAASGCDLSVSREAENITARIEEANEMTRVQITGSLDRNQEIMKQEIKGLQQGLCQLQLEIDRKTEELKEVIIKINTTREGADRKLLKKIGNSATVVLMSLYELQKALQEMLRPMVHKARVSFGTLFGLQDDPITFELETNLSPEIGFSLPMYYTFYYQPLFRNLGRQNPASDVFSKTMMNKWIDQISLTSDDTREISSEAYAFFNLAKNGDELVWTMATLVAGLNACLVQDEAISVLSTTFSLRYDPRCVLPTNGNFSGSSKLDIPSRVALLFDDQFATALHRPRYGLDGTLGKRLKEDYLLLSHLATTCGLQEEISKEMNIHDQISTKWLKIGLTLTLIALMSQPASWEVRKHMATGSTVQICFFNHTLVVGPYLTWIFAFFYAIQSAGVSITFHDGVGPELEFPERMRKIPRSDLQAWYQSPEYNHTLKTESWWPTKADFLVWERQIRRKSWENDIHFQLPRRNPLPARKELWGEMSNNLPFPELHVDGSKELPG